MVKWQYLRLVTRHMPSSDVRRDKKGLYVKWDDSMRLDPQDGWKENEPLWAAVLTKDPESDYWRRDTDVLNRLGQQGWEAVSLTLVGSSGSFFAYLLKRQVD